MSAADYRHLSEMSSRGKAPLLEEQCQRLRQEGGCFNLDLLASTTKLARFYSVNGDCDKAVDLFKDCYHIADLLYGEFHSFTLSITYSLAIEYAAKRDLKEALSHHKDCFTRRLEVLGSSHKDTIESNKAILALEASIPSRNISSSSSSSLSSSPSLTASSSSSSSLSAAAAEESIVLLSNSSGSGFEKRGVTIKLLINLRDYIRRNPEIYEKDPTKSWSIAALTNLVVGNHEVLKPNNRWGYVDPLSTLTGAYRISLIDYLQTFFEDIPHPSLQCSYKEVVGERANIFVSFAYSSSFFDIVDALEIFINKNRDSFERNSTYFWFDPAVNNQWANQDVTVDVYEKWAYIFLNSVKEIGALVMFFSPWDDPIPLKRAWCLYELYCAFETKSKFFICMSSEENSNFIDAISNSGTANAINKMLATIDVQRSDCYLPSDRERIFKTVEKIGFPTINSIIFKLLRQWVVDTIRNQIRIENIEYINSKDKIRVWNLEEQLGSIYLTQGDYNDAKYVFENILENRKRVQIDAFDPFVLTTMNNLATSYQNIEDFVKSEELFKLCFEIRRDYQGEANVQTLVAMNNLALLYKAQNKLHEAIFLFEKCFQIRKSLDESHFDTLTAMSNLALCYFTNLNFLKARPLLENCSRLCARSPSIGERHPLTLTVLQNLAFLDQNEGDLRSARMNLARSLLIQRQIYGNDHPLTIAAIYNLAVLCKDQRDFSESEVYFNEVLELKKKKKEDTLSIKIALAAMISDQEGRWDEEQAILEEILDAQKSMNKIAIDIERKNTISDMLITITHLSDLLLKKGDFCLYKNSEFDEASRYYEHSLNLIKDFNSNFPNVDVEASTKIEQRAYKLGQVKKARQAKKLEPSEEVKGRDAEYEADFLNKVPIDATSLREFIRSNNIEHNKLISKDNVDKCVQRMKQFSTSKQFEHRLGTIKAGENKSSLYKMLAYYYGLKLSKLELLTSDARSILREKFNFSV